MKNFTKQIFRTLIFVLLISSVFVFNSCEKDDSTNNPTPTNIKIAVFSDPHLYDPALGTSGDAFQVYLAQDRKLIAESDAILQALIAKLLVEKPNLVLVPGDLTKDGEKQSHQKFANYLAQLKAAGIKVLVIPGNHDLNNPHSYLYSGATPAPTPAVTPDEFKTIYKDFGYGSPIEFAPNSLSYLAEPVEGLWILGLDVTKHDNNATSPETAGVIKSTDLEWIKAKVSLAKSKGKTIMAMMHHGATEHFTGQSQFFGDYVIDDFANVSTQLADAGLKIVFTGHFHAQDIVKTTTAGNNTLYDIETGSLVTYPVPYRMLELTPEKKLNIKSYRIEQTSYPLGSYSTFQTYAKGYLEGGLDELIIGILMYKFGLTQEQAIAYGTQVVPLMIPAVVAHYEGDEKPTAEQLATVQQLMKSTDPLIKMFANILGSYWVDLPPADNNIIINLNTGIVE